MKAPIRVYLKLIFLITCIFLEVIILLVLPTYLIKKVYFIKVIFHILGIILFLVIFFSKIGLDYKLIFALWLFLFPELFIIPISFFVFSKTEEISLTNLKIANLTYYDSGEDFFGDLKKEILGAKKFIFLQFYIVKSGVLWTDLKEILIKKASEGVLVMLAFDGLGALAFSNKTVKELLNANVKVNIINPVNVFLKNLNKRNHRKLAVIDGKKGFIGGVNLADEYINKKRRFGYWQDSAISFSGEGVNALTTCFFESIKQKDFEKYLVSYGGEKDCLFYFDTPNLTLSAYEEILVENLYNSKEEVFILTPYFIPSLRVEKAIMNTIDRGVKVNILLPDIPDKKSVYLLSKFNALKLKEKGAIVVIIEGAFLHTKSVVFDRKRVLFGSSNTDMRSMYLHYECGMILESDFLGERIAVKAESEKIRSQKQIKENFFQKIVAICINILYPFI